MRSFIFALFIIVLNFNGALHAQLESIIDGTLGIGVTNTRGRLHINSLVDEQPIRASVNSVLKFVVNDNGGVAIGGPFISLPTDGLYVKGNAGIGTTGPAAKLQVNHNGNSTSPQLKLLEIEKMDFARLNFENAGESETWTVLGRTNMDTDTTLRFFHSAYGDIVSLTARGTVGIGTVSPQEKLQIDAPNSGNTKILFSENEVPAASLFYEGSAGTGTNNLMHLRSEINGLQRNVMTWKLNGNVGIGTSDPENPLQIQGGSDSELGSGGVIVLGASSDANLSMDNDEIMARNNGAIAPLYLQDLGGALHMHQGLDEIDELIYSSDHKLGIGNNSPEAKLDINTAAGTSALRAAVDGTTKFRVHSNGSVSVGSNSAGPADGLYVGGSLGIGTLPGPFLLYPQDAVESTGGASLVHFRNSTVTDDAKVLSLSLGKTTPDVGSFYALFFGGDSFADGGIEATGGGGVRYNTTSDQRLKTNIHDVQHGLNTVLKMRPRSYVYKQNPQKDEIGLIAQELLEIYPDAVSGDPNHSVEEPMMIDYGRLTPILIAAIQDLNKKVENLEAQVARLTEEDNN